MENRELKVCSVCDSTELEEILNLPQLPLTGLYFPNVELALKADSYNQGLNRCKNCGHAQLKYAINPKKVYDETYTHRSSGSPISKGGNDFLSNYLIENFCINSQTNLLEVGCNDGYLLQKIASKTNKSFGIDPIWLTNNPPQSKNFEIRGGFASDVKKVLPNDFIPNFVVSAHTFEHTVSLYEELKSVVEISEDDTTFVIEMPSFDTLLRLRRFDQIFHQHIQYISESSIFYLVNRLNCTLNNIKYNFSYWGGTVIFSFKKGLAVNKENLSSSSIKKEKIDQALYDFNSYKSLLSRQICFHKNVYYIGAAQMLPILHYHLKCNIPKISGIFDDNQSRIGKFLPSLDIEILPLKDIEKGEFDSSGFIIGAVDSGKSLIARTKQIGISNIYSFYQNII